MCSDLSDDEAEEAIPELFPLNTHHYQDCEYYPGLMLQESAYSDAMAGGPTNLVLSYSLGGSVDVGLLSKAATTVVGQHPALRVSFTGQVDGFGAAIVGVHRAVPFVVDVQETEFDAHAITLQLFTLEATPFSEDATALVRLHLLHDKDQYHTLVFSAARYACDVTSAHMLMRGICDLYGQDPSRIQPSCASYSLSQIGQWEAQNLRANPTLMERVAEFWSACCRAPGEVHSLRVLRLNAQSNKEAREQESKWSFRALDLDEDCTGMFKEFLVLPDGAEEIEDEDHGLLLCLTSFAVLMRHASKLDDFVIGSSVSVRDLCDEDTGGLVGPLTNNIPLHIITSQAASFIDIFVDLGNKILEARKRSMCALRTFRSVLGMHYSVFAPKLR